MAKQASAYPIRKVAVLGAGLMGAGIAAHLANAGIPSVLFDIVPKDAGDDPRKRTALALGGIEAARKIKPAAFFRPELASLITPANYDDHASLLAECDWIVEVVVERLDIKRKVYEWVAAHRRPGSIVTSNTSGIRLADMAEGMGDELRAHFAITHFFNPVRYMRLLEIVGGADTKPEVIDALATFGERALGKGIVHAKDTPNFVANRIGIFGMVSTFKAVQDMGLTVEQVDAIMGPAMGRPKTAFFRLADLVGLDTMAHVISNIHEYAPDDEQRDLFVVPPVVRGLIEAGAVGNKSGAGFYKRAGKKDFLVLDLQTGEYRPQDKDSARFASVGAARKAETAAAKISALVWGEDDAARFAWRTTAESLIYAANRIPEIADDIVQIDRGMRWGFAWDLGVFESWDAIGVRRSVVRMREEGMEVPDWVQAMLDAGRESFYGRDGQGRPTYWSQEGRGYPVPVSDAHVFLTDIKAQRSPVAKNDSASLHDMGDGILLLEFHSKLNALDADIAALYGSALDKLDDGEFDGLVVGNEAATAFSAGANIFMILLASMQQQWDQIEELTNGLQQLFMRAKYSRKPVITAPHGLTLGGGAECAMHSAITVGTGELYMGLVEVGVGVIPGAGGCKELVMRATGDLLPDAAVDVNPLVQKVFERIATAQVTTSGGEAQAWGFLRPGDQMVLDRDARLQSAKKLARGLADAGWQPPAQRTAPAAGENCRAAIEAFLYQMAEGGYATPHDVVVGKALARVVTGGDVPAGTRVGEQHFLDLEREAFLGLCGTEGTRARLQHMLETNKPLRN
ncbi:MAG: 3-hydroxyacyl-CoA dehydrogenase/enoyl-CoA hydratase family protein [Alphaproteobacteria bacterium]|nr:3-hydroxyacyl-CoA dehydrogenase/enoyl-CoA hydratase family protein [Alphaproteobacteria bacterium]